MQYKRRTDSSHAPIRDYLRKHAAVLNLQAVVDTHDLGDGFPDIIAILKNGTLALMFEIKGEKIRPTDLDDEIRFMLKLVSPVYRIVQTPEAAAAAITELTDLHTYLKNYWKESHEPNA